MQLSKISQAFTLALVMMSTTAQAEEPAFAAKSLFFGEVGDVIAVPTSKVPSNDAMTQAPIKSESKAVVIATSAKKVPEMVKTGTTKQSKELPVGAAYFVRLKKQDGTSQDTLATRIFTTGEKFQVGLKVNRPSYVYIFNEDPNGRITMLQPRPGRTAAVDAMGTVFLPAQGAFQFQGPAGLEKLLVLLSEEEVFEPDATLQKIQPDLVTRAAFPVLAKSASAAKSLTVLKANATTKSTDCSVMVADAGNYASKAIVYAQDTDSSNNCMPSATPAFASKSIVFADDPQPAAGQQVASYVVKPQALAKKEPLLLKIQLFHR